MDYNPKILREVIKLREENSKTYELEDGQNQLVATESPMHYKNENGELKDIDCSIEGDRVTKTPYEAILTKDKIGFIFKKKETNEEVTIYLDKLGDKEISYQLPLINESTAHYEDVDKDIDILIEFSDTGARLYRILKTPEAKKKAIFHIKQSKKGLRVKPRFFGFDSKGLPLNLETNIIKETDEEIYVEDRFTGQVIILDEKTRVRSLSNEVTYPVMIDPEISIKGLLYSKAQIYQGGKECPL